MMGGHDGKNYLNDVWASSDDGNTWREVCGNASWGGRQGHSVVVMSPRTSSQGDGDSDTSNTAYMYVIGGYGPSPTDRSKTESSISADKSNLSSSISTSTSPSPNSSSSSLKSSSADRDKAGAACKRFNDVWRSSDGSTWTRIRHVYVPILLLLVE